MNLRESQIVGLGAAFAVLASLTTLSPVAAFVAFVCVAAACLSRELEAREASKARVHAEALARLEALDAKVSEMTQGLTKFENRLQTIDNRTRKP